MNKLKVNEISQLKSLSQNGNIPKHVAIIMDGNGRWAKRKGLLRAVGHRQGIKTVRTMVEACTNLGIKYLTLYTFSTENWNRPKNEVSTLMRLIVKSLKDETDELNQNGVKLISIGDLSKLPEDVQSELNDAFEKTKNNSRMVLNLALSYSGRLELINAIKSISKNISENELEIENIDEMTVSSFLYTKDLPDPDLLIRTGGEMRISNFLLWQIAYSEIYFCKTLWPDFGVSEFVNAIYDYQSRERRFGLVSEQINQ
jgi:undecaprenyl diphosphate synthase